MVLSANILQLYSFSTQVQRIAKTVKGPTQQDVWVGSSEIGVNSVP